ncbi:hypothetical protein HYW75_00605 [Candidatus Pacearchaeota archaeon]|nr:hypothetical protein [Candidatus Pacearchaeota archaeon]
MKKAKLTDSGSESKRTKRQSINLGGNGVTYGTVNYTEADSEYNVKTLSLGGEEFYAPLRETNDARTSPIPLNIYLIPKKGTKREITPEGAIVLHSTRGVYNLNNYCAKDYFSRTNESKLNVSTNDSNLDNSPRVESLSTD